MQRMIAIICYVCLLSINSWGQSYGLQFSSHEVVQEKRTSLNLTQAEKICFDGKMEISFDLNFRHGLETYFGYIIRIITATGQNIDIVYNQRLLNFSFVVGEEYNGTFEIDQAQLTTGWSNVKIMLNSKTQQAILQIDGVNKAQARTSFPSSTCVDIIFGTSVKEGFQTLDIPPMRIKDIAIRQNDKLTHEWKLAETTGSEAADQFSQKTAVVKNPVWIKPRHQMWQPFYSLETKGTASVAFDPKREVLYITGVDSLYSISVNIGVAVAHPLSKSRKILLPGNQSLYDSQFNRLYNFYFDQKIISTYDPNTNSWSHNFYPGLLTEYWHSNSFMSYSDTSIYIIGGYGQLRYKKSVWRFHIPTAEWDSIRTDGDFFMPRYLAALGTVSAGNYAYIMGGYGSNTGDQAVNPKYNYELFRYDVNNSSFKKIYTLDQPDQQFCFANNMIIDSTNNNFYSLIYPTDRFNSYLRIYKGNLSSPEYEIFDDSIPYTFHDIESYAGLYYAPVNQKLIAVTLFTGKDSITRVKTFTIDFPPNEPENLAAKPKSTQNITFIIAAIISGCVGLLYYFTRLRRKKPSGTTSEQPGMTTAKTATSAPVVVAPDTARPGIYFFGQFHVNNRQGEDITKMFTPLLKELFLLITIYTIRNGKGLSSEALNELLWHDKSEKDAKNNRSVNLAKLKSILERIGNCTISKETGFWQFQNNGSDVYVDYQEYVDLQSQKKLIDRDYILQLLAITQPGSFLHQTEYNWLDDIKGEISNVIIDQFIRFIEKINIAEEAELVIDICNCIFMFDRLNEQALEYKSKSLIHLKRHALANTTYLKFIKEYREIYQEDFSRPFSEIVK